LPSSRVMGGGHIEKEEPSLWGQKKLVPSQYSRKKRRHGEKGNEARRETKGSWKEATMGVQNKLAANQCGDGGVNRGGGFPHRP